MAVSTLQEGNLIDRRRRRFSAGLCVGLLATLAGCGGSALSEPAVDGSTPSASGQTWDVVPTRALTLTPGGTFNLASTLPATVQPGGVFEVDPSGAPLPAGITLVPSGLLTVSSSATGTGNAAGVVFRYTPPA